MARRRAPPRSRVAHSPRGAATTAGGVRCRSPYLIWSRPWRAPRGGAPGGLSSPTRTVLPACVMIAIHVDPEVRDQLRAIAYEQKVPLRGLVCAGLNAVFAQHHKPEIAR